MDIYYMSCMWQPDYWLNHVPGFSKTRNFGPLPFPQINNNWSIQRFISLRGNLHNLHNWRMINNHENILAHYGIQYGWTLSWWRETTHNHYHITVFECMSSVCVCPSWTGAIDWLPSPSQALRIYTVGKWCIFTPRHPGRGGTGPAEDWCDQMVWPQH